MDNKIATSAEVAEAAALPRHHAVHIDRQTATTCELPAALRDGDSAKSAARWAYERLVTYIQHFEEQLDSEHEVAMGFVGGETGVLRIEGLGYFDPDIMTFYGTDGSGSATQLIQHVHQLNVMLRALPKEKPAEPARRIGFRLVSDLEPTA